MLFHAAAASLALAYGTVVPLMQKGTPRHLLPGRVYAAAMPVAAAFAWVPPRFPGQVLFRG